MICMRRYGVIKFVSTHSYKSRICSGATKLRHYALIQISDLYWCFERESLRHMKRGRFYFILDVHVCTISDKNDKCRSTNNDPWAEMTRASKNLRLKYYYCTICFNYNFN